jgi:uncharacterized protein YbaP (TraB family)
MPKLSLIALFAGLALVPTAAQAAPAIWKVSDDDSSIWLFGSIHLLPPDVEWRTSYLDKVVSKADRVFFETDISPEAQVALTTRTFELGFNRDGRLLSEIIGADLTERLRDAADEQALPMAMLLTMQPWMAATTVSMVPMTDMNFSPALGVDTVLSAELNADRKGFLETGDQQLDFLAGGTEEEQVAMLEATLDTLDVMESDLEGMLDAWMSGEPEQLGDIFITQTGGYEKETLDRLIDRRNRSWVEQIATMLDADESNLLVVGAAHLAGEASVIKLLEEQGFTSERAQ